MAGDVIVLHPDDGGRAFTPDEIARIRALTAEPPELDPVKFAEFAAGQRRSDELDAIFAEAGRVRGPRLWETGRDRHDPATAFAEELAPERPTEESC